jgi:epsin
MEFLVKNGSERVIDDARSHLSLLKMLRQFHFIDQNGKDQGINVRNRSKELTDLLSDVEKIRSERKKSRSTRNKYTGVEGGGSFGIGGSGSARYGGFGSEEAGGYGAGYGGSTRGVYGDGGGFGGEGHDEYDEGGRRGGAERFDEYDEYDDGGAQATTSRRKPEASRSSRTTPKKVEPPKPKEPEVDLFEFGDDPPAPAAPLSAPSNGTSSAILSPPSAGAGYDDDFDDFQSAAPSTTAAAAPPISSIPAPNYFSISTATPSSATQFAQPAPQAASQNAAFSNIFSTTSPPPSSTGTPSAMSAFSPPAHQQQKPTGYQPTGPNYFTSVQVQQNQPQAFSTPGNATSPTSAPTIAAGKKPAGGDAFASLLGGSGIKKAGTPTQKGPSMADMAKQKSQAGLYGANAPATFQQPAMGNGKASTGSSGLDDLLG